ncbi:hypothetical protein TNCV_3222291 [Trichonephila clavipes]|nr:hypothetical protein TNCV_3222291 [Trichonephila clavipes]
MSRPDSRLRRRPDSSLRRKLKQERKGGRWKKNERKNSFGRRNEIEERWLVEEQMQQEVSAEHETYEEKPVDVIIDKDDLNLVISSIEQVD